MNYTDPTGYVPLLMHDGDTGGEPDPGQSCEDYGKSGNAEMFNLVCVGSGTGYASIQVNTFIPDEIFPEPFNANVGYGDNRDLFEPGSSRSTQSVLVDMLSGTIMSSGSTMSDSFNGSPGQVNIEMRGDAANGAIGVFGPLADISYHLLVTLSLAGDTPTIRGLHDGFPGYEFTIHTGAEVHRVGYNPRRNGGTLYDLGGGKEKHFDYPHPPKGYEVR